MKRFKDILCVIEPDSSHEPALARAMALAESNQARLTVAHVVEALDELPLPASAPMTGVDVQRTLVEALQRGLDSAVAPYLARVEIQTRLLNGTPFLAITREVIANAHDLVVKMADSFEWLDRLFASDDMQLLRKCPSPLWLIRPGAKRQFRRILAAVDANGGHVPEEAAVRRTLNRQILEIASSLAVSDFAELHIAHAWEAVGERTLRGGFIRMQEEHVHAYVEQVRSDHARSLHALVRELNATLGTPALQFVKPQTHLVKGWARKEIPALAKRLDCDLIVMGTVARTGIPGLLIGNTAETILNQIDCSVLAVKPPGFITTVTLSD